MTAHVLAVVVTAQSDTGATASVTVEQTRRAVDPASGAFTDERLVQRADCRLVKEAANWVVAEFHLQSEEPQTGSSSN